MTLVEINWNPSRKQLLQFGIACFVGLPFIGWICNFNATMMIGLLIVGLLLAIVGWRCPKAISPLFVGIMVLTSPIGMIVGELAMLGIYFGVFFPISLCFRVMRRDSLRLRMDRNAETYWKKKVEPSNVSSYYRRY